MMKVEALEHHLSLSLGLSLRLSLSLAATCVLYSSATCAASGLCECRSGRRAGGT